MEKLTPRERQVVALLSKGMKQTEIARALFVSPRTVEAHVKNARGKTGSASAFDLAVRAAVEAQNK